MRIFQLIAFAILSGISITASTLPPPDTTTLSNYNDLQTTASYNSSTGVRQVLAPSSTPDRADTACGTASVKGYLFDYIIPGNGMCNSPGAFRSYSVFKTCRCTFYADDHCGNGGATNKMVFLGPWDGEIEQARSVNCTVLRGVATPTETRFLLNGSPIFSAADSLDGGIVLWVGLVLMGVVWCL